jgi:hypothetical protein
MDFYDDVDCCDLMLLDIYVLIDAINDFSLSVQDT